MSKKTSLTSLVLIIIIIGGSFIFSGKGEEIFEGTNTEIFVNKIEIMLEVDAPFSVATLNIADSGEITYYAEAELDGVEVFRDKGLFTETQIDTLHNMLGYDNFRTLMGKSSTDEVYMSDLSTYTINVKYIPQGPGAQFADAMGESITCYESECSDEFLEIKDLIIEYWGKEVHEEGV